MTDKKQQHYQQKLKDIQSRHLSFKQRLIALLVSAVFWLLLFLLAERVQYVWVPYVVSIQKFNHLIDGYLTYFFATLFFVVWFYLIYRTFQLALKYLIRAFSGIKEK